jgi:hypothetical protein
VNKEDNMRLQLSAALLIAVVGVSDASAGKLFGDVKKGDKPVAEGVLITLQAVTAKPAGTGDAATAPIDTVVTDKVGSYKATVKGEGKYTLTVLMGKQKAVLEVFSYKEPTRYDLILEEKDGKLTVRRK